jgi:tetratricopeptide (TPR) repeat protein
VTEAAGNRLLALAATSNLGRVCSRAGRLADARRLLEEAFAGFREIGARDFLLETEARLAELELLEGLYEQAYGRAGAALGGVDSVLTATLHRIRGGALLRAGDPGAARGELERSLEVARSLGADYESALTLAQLARVDGSVEQAEEAAAIFERLGVLAPLPGADQV